MLGMIIGMILGGLLFGSLFDLDSPDEIMRHEKGDTSTGKGKAGVLLLLLGIIALLLIEVAPAMLINGIPTK